MSKRKIQTENLKHFLSSANFACAQYKMILKFGEIKLTEKEFHR